MARYTFGYSPVLSMYRILSLELLRGTVLLLFPQTVVCALPCWLVSVLSVDLSLLMVCTGHRLSFLLKTPSDGSPPSEDVGFEVTLEPFASSIVSRPELISKPQFPLL